MNKFKSLKFFSIIIFASGIFDLFGGFYFSFLVGTGRAITNPPTHPFYAVLIGSFLFCFAYLLCLSAFNPRRYLCNIGVVIVSRLFYVVFFFYYFLVVNDFPTTFLPTAIADLIWTILYIVLTVSCDEIRFRDLFLPKRREY